MPSKSSATWAGIPIAANATVMWRFQTGTQPFRAVFEFYEDDWDRIVGDELFGKEGNSLIIKDARDVSREIKDVFLLHGAPSSGPHRRAGVFADRRWKWGYKLVTRDYNIPKRTGDVRRPAGQDNTPIQNQVTVDQFAYRDYSIRPDGKRWTGKQAIEDVLEAVDPGKWSIESWPIATEAAGAGEPDGGAFSIQNVSIRDTGDAAIGRVLRYVPGAEVTVDASGRVRVFDASDQIKTREIAEGLTTTWDGDYKKNVQRFAVRPARVIVHYQREVEMLLEHDDDYNETSTPPLPTRPFVQNVIPTVDPITNASYYDPKQNFVELPAVQIGTFLEAKEWLRLMDTLRPAGSMPWDFTTVRRFWLDGGLDSALNPGNGAADSDPNGNVTFRVGALKQHFRQTFRGNRLYAENSRSIRAERVGVLDPVTGARQRSAVWAQCCMIPTAKGIRVMWTPGDKQYINIDPIPAFDTDIAGLPPVPAQVVILDEDFWLLRIEWAADPYGMVERWIPSNLVWNETLHTPAVDLARQDEEPIGPGLRREGWTSANELKKTSRARMMVTVVPAVPNNNRQFHAEPVTVEEAKGVFNASARIDPATGPDMHVFIPPGELTARFAWKNTEQARATLPLLFGINAQNPNDAGIEGPDLPGFDLINKDTEIRPHALAVAAEVYSTLADSMQGTLTTALSRDAKLEGNLRGLTITMAPAPNGKVVMSYDFPGAPVIASRFSMLPDSARQLILGTLPFGK